jgi:nucleoside-diphosphate-sugar epimerase
MRDHILVTGSAGRVGRAAVEALVAAGLPVVGFDLVSTPGLPADRSIVGTLADAAILNRVAEGARCIIHLGATPDDARFPRGNPPDDGDNFLSELLPNNIVGSYHVMEAARKARVPRVILASTGQVIDGALRAGRLPVNAATLPEPRYLYACTKVFLEALGQVYAKEHGVEVLAVRLGWVPRPGQEEEFRQSEWGPDVYLSPGDAGRFFLSCVTAKSLPGFHVVYATSKPFKQPMYDMDETTRITGYAPQDRWDGGDPTR